MRRWPVRIKLLAIPAVAATLVMAMTLWFVDASRRYDSQVRATVELALKPPGAPLGSSAAGSSQTSDVAAQRALTAAARSFETEELLIGASALAIMLALAAGAWAVSHGLVSRIGVLRNVLSPLQDRGAVPARAGDEMDSLSESLHKAIYRNREREMQLRRSSEFLEFAQAAGGFGIFDLDLVTAHMIGTPLFFELIGLQSGNVDLMRHEWLATVHPEDFEHVVRELNTAISVAGKFQAEYRSLKTDGSGRWLAGRGEVLRDAEGMPARVIGTLTDISERKDLEEALRQTTESLNIAQTAAGVATMDLNFERRSWICSANLHELLGIPSATPLNDLHARLTRVHPEDAERIRRAPFETTPENPSYRCEYRLLLEDRTERWIAEKANVTRAVGGEITRITGVLIDVTDLKRTAAALNSTEKRLARTLLLMADFDKPGAPEHLIRKISQEALADMIGTTRSRVCYFMNRFRKLGYVEYRGGIHVSRSLLNAFLQNRLLEENTSNLDFLRGLRVQHPQLEEESFPPTRTEGESSDVS